MVQHYLEILTGGGSVYVRPVIPVRVFSKLFLKKLNVFLFFSCKYFKKGMTGLTCNDTFLLFLVRPRSDLSDLESLGLPNFLVQSLHPIQPRKHDHTTRHTRNVTFPAIRVLCVFLHFKPKRLFANNSFFSNAAIPNIRPVNLFPWNRHL